MQSVLLVHDTVRARSYETPLPAYDPNFHPQTQYSRHRHHGRGPEYRTVGLHKSANEPLVSEYLIVILMHVDTFEELTSPTIDHVSCSLQLHIQAVVCCGTSLICSTYRITLMYMYLYSICQVGGHGLGHKLRGRFIPSSSS